CTIITTVEMNWYFDVW
nr:immunoglobulin heavy chain junction region [Mus musculus]MBK4184319.1 immunoglobulin heavy chain junction region [Mus musculus]MBK4184320.1 immunoglobulin heavy chain junction region [Mus musculus]MBK4184322.1 immunoglobulin heavy chain junction region [Mus musculus]